MSISPAVIWDNNWIFGFEDEFHKKRSDLPVSLFMTGAEKEWPDFVEGIRQFDKILKSHNYQNFRYSFRVLDDAYHSGAKPEGYTRGMKFIFEPILKK
jgi:uncharacterized protein